MRICPFFLSHRKRRSLTSHQPRGGALAEEQDDDVGGGDGEEALDPEVRMPEEEEGELDFAAAARGTVAMAPGGGPPVAADLVAAKVEGDGAEAQRRLPGGTWGRPKDRPKGSAAATKFRERV